MNELQALKKKQKQRNISNQNTFINADIWNQTFQRKIEEWILFLLLFSVKFTYFITWNLVIIRSREQNILHRIHVLRRDISWKRCAYWCYILPLSNTINP